MKIAFIIRKAFKVFFLRSSETDEPLLFSCIAHQVSASLRPAVLASLHGVYVSVPRGAYRLTRSIVPAGLSVCHTHTCICTGRAVAGGWSPPGVSAIVPARSVALRGPILGQRGLMRNYRAYIHTRPSTAAVLVMQNSQHKLNSSRRREFVFYGINCRPSRRRERECLTWRLGD